MKVRILSSGLTTIALLFATPALSVQAQFSHPSNTSIEQVSINPKKNKDFFDDLRGVLNSFNPTQVPQTQTQPTQTQAQFATNF